MSRRPDFLRESMWKQLTDGERDGIIGLMVAEREAMARVEKAQADVATHRRLARTFADQARNLMESVRDRADSHGSPPSVYTPPVTSGMSEPPPVRGSELPGKEPEPYEGPEEMDEDDRDPTQVGAVARVRSSVKREPTLSPETLRRDTLQSYEGDLEIIEDVEEI